MPSSKNSSIQIWIFILLGGMVGLFISTILNLPYRWMTVIMMAICLPFIGFIVGDLRRFFMLLLILSIPLMIDINFIHKYEYQAGAQTAGISLRDIFIILLLVVWLLETVTTEGLRVRFFASVTIPALLYIEACLITFLWAPRVDLATLEIIQMAKVFILYFVLANNLRDVKDIRFIAWALLATLAFESTIAILQMITGRSLGLSFLGEFQVRMSHGMRFNRVGGTLGHPNKLAMYLELLLPLCAGLFYSSNKLRDRFIAAGAFSLGVIALIMTGSRGAWIAFFVSIALFVYILIRKRLVELRTIIVPTMLIFLIICIVFASFWGSIHKRITGDDHGSAMGRIPLIQVALAIIRAHPIGGVGLNNYAVIMQDYDHTILGRMFTRLERPVHNTYLLITAETGFIGFAAFAWLMLAALYACRKAVRQKNLQLSFVGVGIVCGLAAFLIHGLVEKHPPGGYPLFYTLLALAASTAAVNNNVNSAEFDTKLAYLGEQSTSTT